MDNSLLLESDNEMTNFSSTGSRTPTANIGGHLIILTLIVYNVFAFFGNLLIIKVVPRIPTDAMEDSSKVCFIGQAVTDGVVSILFIIGPFSETIGDWTGWSFGRLTFCRGVGVLATALVGVSIVQILLLNTDRYLFITKPMLYPRIATRYRVLGASIILSTLHISLIFLFIGINDASLEIIQYDTGLKMCIINFQEAVFLPFSYCVFGEAWLAMLFLVFEYLHIIKISMTHLKVIKPSVVLPNDREVGQSERSGNSTSSTKRANVQKKALFTDDSPEEAVGFNNGGFIGENSNDRPKPDVKITLNGLSDVDKVAQNVNIETIAETHGRTGADNPEGHLQLQPKTNHSLPSCSSSEPHPSGSPSHVKPKRPRRQEPPQLRSSQLRHNLRILKTPLIITSCYFFSFLPISFINIYVASTGRSVNPLFHAFFSILVAFNGGVNWPRGTFF